MRKYFDVFRITLFNGLIILSWLTACIPSSIQPTPTSSPSSITGITGAVLSTPTIQNDSPPTPEASQSSEKVPEPYITTTQELTSIRRGPGTVFQIIETAPAGKKYPVVGACNDWWRIKLDATHSGWIYKPLVKFTGKMETVKEIASPPTPSN